MLESNPAWDLGGFYVVKFAASNETVTSGLHSGAANFFSVRLASDHPPPPTDLTFSRLLSPTGQFCTECGCLHFARRVGIVVLV